MSSKVYFTDCKARFSDSILGKYKRLLEQSELGDICFENKIVAIKVHFGEWGNMAFLRHQYAKILAEFVQERGGKAFVTDASTLYPGMRGNAVDHLNCAAANGYNELTVGVPVIIADGLRGTDSVDVPLGDGADLEVAKIASAIAEADILLSLTHCKGHIEAGFGAVMKNLGMGSGSKLGKMVMHSNGTPDIHRDNCIGCGSCVRNCANDGIHVIDGKAVIDEEHCLGCGYCFAYCPVGAIDCKWDQAKPVLSRRIVEYAKGAINGHPSYHVAIAMDVQPNCDCSGARGVQLVNDVGIFASADPVALEQACKDAIDSAVVMKGSKIEAYADAEKRDVFKLVHPKTDWEAGAAHSVEIGMGSREYELVTIK